MWLLWSGLGLAAEPDAVALWEAFQARVVASDASARPFECQTGLVNDVVARWDAFDPDQQAAFTQAFAPFKASLVDPMPQLDPASLQGPVGLDGSVRAYAAADTCWGQQGSNRVMTEHFSVEWDSATISSSTATAFGEALERSWDKEFDDLGWQEPDGANTYKIMAFISESNAASAYTTVSACGSVYMPYIVAGRGSFSGGVWYQDMAAHELNHASQFSYALGLDDQFWFYEATATYLQDQIWPTHEIWASYTQGYADHPGLAMAASDQEDQTIFYHMYGMNIWLFWLDENAMGEEGARTQWEYLQDNARFGEVDQESIVGGLGYDFHALYTGFMAANTVMDYAQQRYYPEIDVEDYIDELPAEGDAIGAAAPERLGQHYLRLDRDAYDSEAPNLELFFKGRQGGEWIALIVGASDDEVKNVVEVALEDDVGSATLEDWGQYDEVWVVVSPTSADDELWGYYWSLEATAPPEPEPEPDTDVVDTGEEATLLGCACDQSGTSGPFAALAALVGLVGLRRRR